MALDSDDKVWITDVALGQLTKDIAELKEDIGTVKLALHGLWNMHPQLGESPFAHKIGANGTEESQLAD